MPYGKKKFFFGSCVLNKIDFISISISYVAKETEAYCP